MPHDVELKFLGAGLDVLVAGLSLLMTFLVGRYLTASWNLYQKRREQNLESVRALHDLYGEFKEVLKIWRVARAEKNSLPITPDERWNLLKRACAVEGKTEALVLRLATERNLEEEEPRTVGLFRQAIQSLRQSIRDDEASPFGDRGVEYDLMNKLAPEVSAMVTEDLPRKGPNPETTKRQLSEIVAVRSNDWNDYVASRKAELDAMTGQRRGQ